MITNLQTFVINSYFCSTVNNKTNQINYYFDCPQHFLSSVTHISCVNLNIPKTWYQLDETDKLILEEGLEQYEISYTNGNYNTIDDLIIDLENKLDYASQQMGNSHKYTVTKDNSKINTGGLKIVCNDKILPKAIICNDSHLRIMYGINQINDFINNDTLYTSIINLNPIDQLYVHCSGVTTYNTSGLFSSDILGFVNADKTNMTFSLKSNMKNFSGQKNIILSITDFDNELIDLNGNNWSITICLFKYEETFIEKMKILMDYEVMKDQLKNNETNYGIIQNY